MALSVLALIFFAETNANATQQIEAAQPLPQLPDLPPTPPFIAEKPESTPWQEHQLTIRPNGSLSQALDSLNIDAQTCFQITQAANSHLITNLRAQDKLRIWTDEAGQLQKILYPKTRTHQIILKRNDAGFEVATQDLPVQNKIVTATGTIEDSLYLSAEKAGLSAKTIMKLADIFAWEIDFIRELRQGDTFKVIYEQRFLNEERLGDGNIIAAEIVTEGKYPHRAFLLKDAQGEPLGYFDENQKSLKKTFLRNPVDYVRITSTYTPKRFHPVQHKWKAHRGIDYGGPIGTPIHVTGNGKIIKQYHSNSYGKVVYVQHAGKYTTVYAHLSRFGKFHTGQNVKQGQVIGYLGRTGWASGPHLHYELRMNGQFKDPLKVKFPDAGPVPKIYQAQFAQFAHLMQSHLDRFNPYTQLASHFE